MNLKRFFIAKISRTIINEWAELRGHGPRIELNYPPEERFGDYSTNIAMQLAPLLHRSPMDIAQTLVASLGGMAPVETVEIVPPGFINFKLKHGWLKRQVAAVLKEKTAFARSDMGAGKKIVIEFVSANPTGPVTIANGRAAFAGDTLANVLALGGFRPRREYYINDIGNQVNILAESVVRRYWIQQGIKMEYPEYCYQGTYISDLARRINVPNYKLNNVQKIEEVRDKIKGRILEKMIRDIQKLLVNRLGIKYDEWFSEKTLYSSGTVDTVLALLKKQGVLYKSEGAIWLRTTVYGDDKDRVLIKANEEPVYFLSDIALRYNRFFKRKFDREIFLLGADHHGYIGRMQAAMQLLGLADRLDIIIIQMVRLLKKGQEVRMSKRSGTFVTLDELVEEVGVDAARFFFLMHEFNSHMDFDMDLAKKQSKDNPVYYVQYAHARICSILKKVQGFAPKAEARNVRMELPEVRLIKTILKWPELVTDVSQTYHVHRLPFYAIELATQFHDFYTQCRVIQGRSAQRSRVQLIRATQIILRQVLGTMGITAPEKM